MDRKKKVLSEFAFVMEEKEVIEKYLKKVVDKVVTHIQQIQENNIKISDFSKVLTFEMTILKLFNEINMQLEHLLELNVLETSLEPPKSEMMVVQLTNIPNDKSNNTETIQNCTKKPNIPKEHADDLCISLSPVKDLSCQQQFPAPTNQRPIKESKPQIDAKPKNLTETKQFTYTALEKLNNYKPTEKEKRISPSNRPNIDLVPAGIENSLIRNNLGNKKIKLKKKTTENLTPPPPLLLNEVYYEISYSKAPIIEHWCSFCHIENPSHFYIHLFDHDITLIDKLSEDIAQQYNTSLPFNTKSLAYYGIKRFCCVFIEDKWYRGEVLDWRMDVETDDVLVKLVDFGRTYNKSFQYLRKLTENVSVIPALAVRCHFPLMTPPNGLVYWPRNQIENFIELSGLTTEQMVSNKYFQIHYVRYSLKKNSYAIDLFNEEESMTLGQLLLDLCIAAQTAEDEE